MRLVVKSDADQTSEAMAEPDPPPNPEINPWEVSGDDRRGIVDLFESLRGKLIIFFEVRQCVDPEELADATLERVVKRLCKGAKVSDLTRYSFGVAKHIFQEYLRRQKATLTFMDQQKYQSEVAPDYEESDAAVRERQLTCLEECMERLKEHDRTLLLQYYQFKGQLKLEHRRKMAEQLNISREALTLRVFHLKQKLKKCVSYRLENM